MAKKSGCTHSKARVKIGSIRGRCHLGKNRRIYCCRVKGGAKRTRKASQPSFMRLATRRGAPVRAVRAPAVPAITPRRMLRAPSGRTVIQPRAGMKLVRKK